MKGRESWGWWSGKENILEKATCETGFEGWGGFGQTEERVRGIPGEGMLGMG